MNCILVEDDFSYSVEIEMILQELDIDLIESVDNDKDALISIIKNKPDFVLMDIEIKGELKGTDIAKEINHLNIPVIFITSFETEDYFGLAKEIKNTAFLTKPIKKFDLQSTINLLLNAKKQTSASNFENDEKILVKGVKQFFNINKNDILYIKADKNYSMVFVENNKFLIRYKLSEFEEMLPHNFVRCHRSYIVNMNCIQSVDFTNNVATMNNDENININMEAKRKIENYFEILK